MFGNRFGRAVASTFLFAAVAAAAAGCSSTDQPFGAPAPAAVAGAGTTADDAPGVMVRGPQGATVTYRATSHGGPAIPVYMSRGAKSCSTCAAAADTYLKGGELKTVCETCGGKREPISPGPTRSR